jgi:hypothetical protein
MRKLCISNLPYLLLAMLLMAMTGCGANSRVLNSNDGASGSVTAKLVVGKGAAAKAVASALPSGIASLQFTVTGTDANGKAIPVVRNTITETVNGKGTVTGIYPGQVTVAVKALSSTGAVVYEGFAINVTVVAGLTPSDAGTIVLSAPLTKAQDANCVACHETTLDVNGQNLVADFKQSGHYTNLAWTANDKFGVTGTGCAGCHGPSHNDSNPADSGRCFECHGTNISAPHRVMGANLATACSKCHAPHNTQILGCIGCHSVPQNATDVGAYVNDNNGVRVITTEFGKWSHHVTGVTLNDAHCAACHLEGKIKDNAVAVDITKHMVDAKIHLRNVDDDSDMQWDPATPNHSTMDNFCLSCHDANGATSPASQTIQAFINANGVVAAGKTASALNPFGDTISNQYDKMQRPAVVDANSQFNTSNNSHHAVKGKRYSGRSRATNGGTIADAAFTANSSANLPGKRTTIYDAGKFTTTYVTLANAGGETGLRNGGTKLGDDSTLHCGDCHTVGQWKAGSSINADGTATPVAIGAHGSANEYLLRNSMGTDARHQGIPQTTAKGLLLDGVTPLLVCYNCHKVANYGTAAHVGEQVSENNCNMATNTNTVNKVGTDRLMSQYTKTIGTLVAGANSGADYSNIFGIQCNNCHNSGISAGNIFGGIHGSADPTYVDGAGNITKHERFLPGLGNVMYVPGTRGGISGGTTAFQSYSSKVQTSGISIGLRFKGSYAYTTGGITNDMNWEEKSRIPVGDGVTGWSHNPGAAGCYTISAGNDEAYNAESNGVPAGPAAAKGLTAPDGTLLFGTWGGCDDHSQQAGASVRQPRNNNTSIRPVSY